MKPEARLKSVTNHPMTYYRALEGEKSKAEFLKMIYSGLGMDLVKPSKD